MNMYNIPPDIREKEKIIGGIFTLTQLVFLIVGALVGAAVGWILFRITGSPVFSIIVGIIFILPFIPFAFVTIPSMGDIELFQYVLYKYKFSRSQREFPNINENYRMRGGNV